MWPPAGERVAEIVRQEALDIYHNHKPPALPEGAADQLESILIAADSELIQ